MIFKYPCDSCAFRRVKCDRQYPCQTCFVRSQTCTYLRIRKRPGPKQSRKGSFAGASSEIPGCSYLDRDQPERGRYGNTLTSPTLPGHYQNLERASASFRIPVTAYLSLMDLFQSRLFTVWPIVSVEKLKDQLTQRSDSVPSAAIALAAAICAATMAQLGLVSTATGFGDSTVTAEDFVKECLQFKGSVNEIHEASVQALVTSVFLHMFYANRLQITAATLTLREAITHADVMNLGQEDSLLNLDFEDREWRLRVYWILFVTERTFCTQHNLRMILRKCSHFPSTMNVSASSGNRHDGFIYLAQLFNHIDSSLLPIQRLPPPAPSSASKRREYSEEEENSLYSGTNIVSMQENIRRTQYSVQDISETQRADIIATSTWVRSLLWQYSASHLILSSGAGSGVDVGSVHPLSLSYPFLIGRDLLSCLSGISLDSLRTHGYGMDIKLSRMTSILLDLLSCIPDPQARRGNHFFQQFRPFELAIAIEKLRSAIGFNAPAIGGGALTVGGALAEKSHNKLQGILQNCLFSGIPDGLALPAMTPIETALSDIQERDPSQAGVNVNGSWQVVELEDFLEGDNQEKTDLDELLFDGIGIDTGPGIGTAVGAGDWMNSWIQNIC